MEKELFDIPNQAWLCFEKNKGLILPEKVPYIGMGSSYFSALVLRYLGVRIFPELAGEYYQYMRNLKEFDKAVLISQSGRTTDVIKCASCFKEITVVVNDTTSLLSSQPNVRFTVPLYAGDERFSPTKTFINSLVVLYLGHGFDIKMVLHTLSQKFHEYESIGESMGSALANAIRKRKAKCIIVGSGPNMGTAMQAALMLSESTRFPFIGMSLMQYEHGYKETAENSIVIVINPAKGVLKNRIQKLIELLKDSEALVFEVAEPELDEIYSPFTSILPFYFMAHFLSVKLGVDSPFHVGHKVTEWYAR